MLILETQRRQSGHAYAALLRVSVGERYLTLVLQHHPVGDLKWQASLYEAPQVPPLTPPLWQSEKAEAATQAIDALLDTIAPFGLPDALYSLVTALLPTEPVDAPEYR